MSNGLRAAIAGVGAYVPEKVLTNADLEKLVDTSDEWITQRTGIRERRVASNGESTASNSSCHCTRDTSSPCRSSYL